MARPTTSSTLKVPGASLYYEIQGSGPTLLIIPADHRMPASLPMFRGISPPLHRRCL